jgi:hypothetical protein
MDSSLSGAGVPVDGGAPMGESSDIKFRTFIESLKTEANASTISTIMEGYDAIMEARKHDPKAEVRNKKSPYSPPKVSMLTMIKIISLLVRKPKLEMHWLV